MEKEYSNKLIQFLRLKESIRQTKKVKEQIWFLLSREEKYLIEDGACLQDYKDQLCILSKDKSWNK